MLRYETALAPWAFILVAAAAPGCVSEAHSQPTTPSPRSLEECYMRVALEKSAADMAHLARELCDAVFKPPRRSLFVIEANTQSCVEWWFDARGRYESPSHFCTLERTDHAPGSAADRGTNERLVLACQLKDKPARVSLVELEQRSGELVRIGTSVGADLGPVFLTLSGCVRYRAQKP